MIFTVFLRHCLVVCVLFLRALLLAALLRIASFLVASSCLPVAGSSVAFLCLFLVVSVVVLAVCPSHFLRLFHHSPPPAFSFFSAVLFFCVVSFAAGTDILDSAVVLLRCFPSFVAVSWPICLSARLVVAFLRMFLRSRILLGV